MLHGISTQKLAGIKMARLSEIDGNVKFVLYIYESIFSYCNDGLQLSGRVPAKNRKIAVFAGSMDEKAVF